MTPVYGSLSAITSYLPVVRLSRMRVPVPCSVAASASLFSRPQQAVRVTACSSALMFGFALNLSGKVSWPSRAALFCPTTIWSLYSMRQRVAVPDHLRQLVAGVDVNERERHVAEERLARQPQQHGRVLADRPQHAEAFEVPERLAEDENALLFELIEVIHGRARF